ncbi:hypothetical protein [Roseicyclus mahoneyensis]|uniref:Uncharacterized protein n=1 Tax=Roseicyclus mahoneyensis TaxID=164332 RepID=A0A316GF33_9RHOB|nr:hypothetical protein [Roseicyclus mahoneyensis]PWK59623.1 hypothetical protein C7455_107168 [Roseicyclus mahoneyensis]
MSTQDDEQPIAGHGVIVRAQNGDVIRYDPTGLVMRLSDKVIADIALRLGQPPGQTPPAAATPKPATDIDHLLDGIDAWGITQDGDWLRFTARLPGAQGVRGFRRHIDGGATLGDGPGAVLGILGLGGPRAALATPGAPAFPHHITAPEDDIGAVGMAGIEPAPVTDRLEGLREATHEALVAETILHWQIEKFAPLPLIVTRVETDASASATDLARGLAVTNLLIAAGNLKSAAARMGKRAKILAICLDYALEHVTGDAVAYRDGMLATLRAVEQGLGALGFDRPLFVARFEAGLDPASAGAVLQGQWELAWNHGDHRLIFSSPSYPFARDAYDRPSDDARRRMAELTAAALSDGAGWRCPTLFLAEWEPGAPVIRVTAQADGPLVIDGGGTAGFAVTGAEGIVVEAVTLAADDPQALLVRVSQRAEGLRLTYAAGIPGALRDGWSLDSRTGTPLHRWALPAILPVHEGRHA